MTPKTVLFIFAVAVREEALAVCLSSTRLELRWLAFEDEDNCSRPLLPRWRWLTARHPAES